MSPVLMPMPMSSAARPSACPLPVQLLQRRDHRQRRLHGVLGVVRVVQRRAVQRHHHVADELVHRAAVLEDHLHHPREVLIQLPDDVFGRALLGQRREAAHVGEEHRHVRAARRRAPRATVWPQLLVDVLRHVAREQPLDLPLLAPFDEVLPREVADEGPAQSRAGGDTSGNQSPPPRARVAYQATPADERSCGGRRDPRRRRARPRRPPPGPAPA